MTPTRRRRGCARSTTRTRPPCFHARPWRRRHGNAPCVDRAVPLVRLFQSKLGNQPQHHDKTPSPRPARGVRGGGRRRSQGIEAPFGIAEEAHSGGPTIRQVSGTSSIRKRQATDPFESRRTLSYGCSKGSRPARKTRLKMTKKRFSYCGAGDSFLPLALAARPPHRGPKHSADRDPQRDLSLVSRVAPPVRSLPTNALCLMLYKTQNRTLSTARASAT